MLAGCDSLGMERFLRSTRSAAEPPSSRGTRSAGRSRRAVCPWPKRSAPRLARPGSHRPVPTYCIARVSGLLPLDIVDVTMRRAFTQIVHLCARSRAPRRVPPGEMIRS